MGLWKIVYVSSACDMLLCFLGVSLHKEAKMAGKKYGYVRVSSKDQNEDRQIYAMLEYGIEKADIFVDKQSGKDFNRPEYKHLLKKLKQDDIIVIKSIDRLGRNYQDILEQWRMITKEMKVGIIVIDMPLLDTKQGRDLTGTLISDIVLQLLSYVAEMERSFIKQRQAEGIAAAKLRGVRFGPPMKERTAVYYEYLELWNAGKVSAREAAEKIGIHHKTFLRWAKE